MTSFSDYFMKLQHLILIVVGCLWITACSKKSEKAPVQQVSRPQVKDGGQTIVFSNEKESDFFKGKVIESSSQRADLKAPARVVATVVRSDKNAGQNLVLFDNSDLTANYTQLLQHTINIQRIRNVNIRQKRIELERAKDLQANGAASGKEVLEAQTALAMEETNLANEKAAEIEHEAMLRLAGFQPEMLLNAKNGTVWMICEMPENQSGKVKEGDLCVVVFTSLPNQPYKGKVESIGNVVDNVTRMVKMRISIVNPDAQLRAGMFATVQFDVSEGNYISVPKEALVTVQGKDYVFVQKDKHTFERRPVMTGQQLGSSIIIYNGLAANDKVVTEGAMQLKGLSFGY
ncbi:efflux RND transporter periplasmic adaptor subunit [Xanthocytophaga agilis]|nr:efflux RND transporter periplasmic adaptor subunit [Xanthocytophaga agilis]